MYKFWNVIIILIIGLFFSCNNNQPKQINLHGLVQGTYYHISYFPKTNNKNDIIVGIDSIFKAIDRSVSLWDTSSIIVKINNNIPVKCDSIFIENFLYSQKFSQMTNGSFDITIGGLVEAYGFAAKERGEINDRIIDSLLEIVDYRSISLRGDSLIKKHPNTKIDFNAIAQGYTTDKISDYLISKNISSFIIDVGGEVRSKGIKPNGKKWTCGIETPSLENNDKREFDYYLELQDEAIVSSGNYRKFYIENGKKYSHTINPKTGKNINHSLLSVSVIAKDAVSADALATAFMVMGLDSSINWLESYPTYQAHFIYSDNNGDFQTYTTKELKLRLIENK